jgi:hypothetical protein
MRSVSNPRSPRRDRHPAQRRKGGFDGSGEDLYATFSEAGNALRPWDELPESQQKRWEAVAESLCG